MGFKMKTEIHRTSRVDGMFPWVAAVVFLLALRAPAASGDEVASRIREAIDKLGSTNLVERNNTASALRQFGKRGVPDLLRTARTETALW